MPKLVLIAGLMFCLITGYSQAGSLDINFGIHGITNTNILDINSEGEGAFSVAIQADGKILIAGTASYLSVIYRYNNDFQA